MTTSPRAADQIDSMQALEPSRVESEQEHTAAENYKEQRLHDKDEKAMIPSDISRDAQDHFGYTNEAVACPPNIYAPQPQMFLYGDWLSQDVSGSVNPVSPLTAPPQPIGASGPFPQSTVPVPYLMNQRPFGFGSSYGSYDAPHSYEEPGPNFGDNNRRLARASKCKKQEKGIAPPMSCNGCYDFLHEQNRGPRASRPKKQATEEDSLLENKNEEPYLGLSRELFITEYEVAMFFVIKSFSEDNIHKSIKYGVWTSTPSGNKKLDSAYRGAKEREDPCPVFLFFSVNASGHFCGVAEMIGPVDFEKSVDFWQQNRWSGCFPVKWQIVKDVPNHLFRHIVLENNDNKPISNSRDTQEVNLEQGLEMLSIFKNQEAVVSVLDDFGFYEEREKAILENKQKQKRKREAVCTDAVNQISDDFSQVIQIVESNNAEIRI